MLDYRIHYAIMAAEDRIRDASRDRSARKSIPARVVRVATERRADRNRR